MDDSAAVGMSPRGNVSAALLRFWWVVLAGVVVGLLEFVGGGNDLDLEADPLKVIAYHAKGHSSARCFGNRTVNRVGRDQEETSIRPR